MLATLITHQTMFIVYLLLVALPHLLPGSFNKLMLEGTYSLLTLVCLSLHFLPKYCICENYTSIKITTVP